MSMARDRHYVTQTDNPLLSPPPTNSAAFFRAFPAHFDVTDSLGQQVIRFEFWNVPLCRLPGRAGQLVARRVRRAALDTGMALARLRLVLLVPQYTHRQERRERQALRGQGAQLEVFPHHFFARVNQLHRQPCCQLLADRMLLEHFQDVYGSVANLPKISANDFMCRYLGAGPGDILLSHGALGTFGGIRSWRLVVPCRRPRDEHPGDLQALERRVRQRRDDSASFMSYLRTISEDPNYY